MASLSEVERFGFVADDIKNFLAKHDFHISGKTRHQGGEISSTPEPEAPPIAEKPLSRKERNTLLTIIAVLCKEAKLDYTTASKTADLIESTADSMGVSISKTAIRDHLKKIPDALGTRTR